MKNHVAVLSLLVVSLWIGLSCVPLFSEAASAAARAPVRILPVFVYPSQGATMGASEVSIAKQNFSTHLQMARRMYRRMLENPLNGEARGTFELASWDPIQHKAVAVTSYHTVLTPLEMSVPQTTSQIIAEKAAGTYSVIDTVMDEVGCTQMSCRYIFAVVVVDTPFFGAGALKVNQGLDNGGGLGLFSWPDVRASNLGNTACNQLRLSVRAWDTNGCSHFLSTLVHELGHSFGLNHVQDYGGSGVAYDGDDSPSIMSYNLSNWIPGCGEGNEVANGSIPCSYPTNHSVIDAAASGHFPGVLLLDDIRVLGLNHGAFPGFEFIRSLYSPTGEDPWLYQISSGYAEIPGQERLRLWPHEYLNFVVGLPIAQVWEPIDTRRTWTSTSGGVSTWVDVDIEFPWDVELTRVRMYTGHAGEPPVQGTYYDAPTHARILRIDYGNPNATPIGSVLSGFQPLNQTLSLPSHSPPDRYRLQLARGTSGVVTLRGLRFWGKRDGSSAEAEFFPTVGPNGSTSHGTYGGSSAAILGSDQEVDAYADPWDATTSWHSAAVSCGDWISVTVTFPEEVTVADVKVHTGHSGAYHVATTIQIERECTCRNTPSTLGENCRAESQANCAAAGGPGSQIFEHVTGSFATPDTLLSFAPESSHRWKVAMKTPPGQSQCHLTVRGLRFFNEDHLEHYPARQVAPGGRSG